MATIGLKANNNKLTDDFDNFNFDDFNMDAIEPKDDRHPVIKSLSPIKRGAKEYITNGNNIEKFVKAAMPRGYGQAYELGREATSELRQLYNSAEEELRPIKETSKSLLRRALPKLDGKIPKKLHNSLKNFSKSGDSFQGSQGDGREEQLGSLLQSIFEQKATDEVTGREDKNAREKIAQGFAQIRHRDQISQLDAIRIAAQSQVQYQNNVTYNVQKKQLEIGYRQLWALADLNKEQKRNNAEMLTEMKIVRKNTGLPDFVKQTASERFGELVRNKFLENTREGMFGGAQDYFRKFTRNLRDQVLGQVRGYTNALSEVGNLAEGAADGMSAMEGMPGFSVKDELIAGGTKLGADWLAEKGARVASKVTGRNSKTRRVGSMLGYGANTTGERMHEYLTSSKHSWGPFEAIREMLANAAPSNTPESRMEADSLARMHEPKPFNRNNSKSLDEIIPGFLARIHREIKILRTGDESTELITYDHVKNKFSTEKDFAAGLRKSIVGGRSESANRHADAILNKIDRKGKLTKEQRDLARRTLIEKSVMGESIDIKNISTGANWGGGEDGDAIAAAFNTHLKAKDGRLPMNDRAYRRQNELLGLHRGITSGIGDPRVILQQLTNAGQLDTLRRAGILDESNTVNRKLFAEWLMNETGQELTTSQVAKIPTKINAPRRVRKPGASGSNMASLRGSGPRITNIYGSPSGGGMQQSSQMRDSSVEKNVQSIADLLTRLEGKYEFVSDLNSNLFQSMLHRLDEISIKGLGQGDGGLGGGGGTRAYTSLWEHARDKATSVVGKAGDLARAAGARSAELWKQHSPTLAKHGSAILEGGRRSVADMRGKLQNFYGDVFVTGERYPRIRASLLAAGEYRDKATGRIITSLEDITGDIEDAAGNLVITLDEFYNGYVGGSINKKVKQLFGEVKSKLDNWRMRLQDFVPGAIKNARSKVLSVFEAVKDALPPYDVYVKTDMKRPLLYASKMRFEMYFSMKTGNPIRHPRDIDGVVIDKDGNIIVSEDHIQDGLVDIDGDSVGRGIGRLVTKGIRKVKNALEIMREAAVGLFGAVGKGMANAGQYFKNFFSPFTDMITNSGKTVTLLEKIHAILDERLVGRKKVRGDLSGDGVRDGSIEDIRRKREQAAGIAAGLNGDKAKAPGGILGSLLAGIGGLFKKKNRANEDEDDEEDDDGFGLDDAADAADLYDTARGDRGSNERKRAAKKRLKRMRRRGGVKGGSRLGRLAKWGMFNTDIVNGLGKTAGTLGKAGMSVGRRALPLVGKAGLLGAAAYGTYEAGSALMDDNKTGAQKANAVGRAAAGAAGGWAGASAGAAMGAAAGSVVPVLGTGIGAVVGGLIGGAFGYWGAQKLGDKLGGLSTWWNTPKLSNLSKLRLIEYGFGDADKDAKDKIFRLEAMLEPHSTIREDGNLYLDEKEVNFEDIAKLFEITRGADMQLFNLWYRRRFVPVFRFWLNEVRKIDKDGKLARIEAIIPGKDKLVIADKSATSMTEPYRHMVGWAQSRLKLQYDAQGVKDYLDSIRAALMKEREGDGGEKATVENRSSVGSTTREASALALKAMTNKANYNVRDKDGNAVDPNSMNVGDLTEKIKKGDVTVSVAVNVPANLLHNDSSTLDALTSIRYKAYGLNFMSADKARMLSALERFVADQMTADTESSKLNMSTDKVMQVAGEVFGIPNASGEHATRWKEWYNGRFLPVFLLWAGSIRQKTGKSNLTEAHRSYPLADQLALGRAIIGAQGINKDGARVSVWHISSNPWTDAYELNSDADSTAGNLEAIRQLADKVRLGEVTGKPNATNRQLDSTKSDHGKGWNNNNRGTLAKIHNRTGAGVNATGDSITSETTKASGVLSGIGDPIRFSSGASGNYTDLPVPTGTGWAATRETLLKAAAMAGVDPKALITTIAVESSFNPNAAPSNPNLPSSAKGLGQHLDSSWLEDLGRDGKKFGIPAGTNQFDARASALMTASRLKFNGERLSKSLGRAVTITDLYLAHLMGLGGATKFLKAPADAIGAEVAPTTAKQHPEYFYKGGKALSVKEVYANFAQKLASRPAEFGVTDADMRSAGGATSTEPPKVGSNSGPSGDQATVAKAAAAAGTGSAASPAAPSSASYGNTPSAGSPRLQAPITMDSGKGATMGTGPAIVNSPGAKYELILQRENSEEDGTYGTLRLPDGTVLNTLELPWKDNQPRVSSIPPGVYPCKKRPTKSHGSAYEVNSVPGRSAILIHAGNSAGSTESGMKADSQGCILLGMDRGRKGSQKVITASKAAMQLFHEKMADMPFTLIVRNGKNDLATGEKSASFDPVRKPAVNASVAPRMDSPSQAATPSFTPSGPRISPDATPASGSELPRIAPQTTTSTSGFSKQAMQQQSELSSASIAPVISTISNTLINSLTVQTDGVALLRQLLEEVRKGPTPVEKVTTDSNKVRPLTNSEVPVTARRNM